MTSTICRSFVINHTNKLQYFLCNFCLLILNSCRSLQCIGCPLRAQGTLPDELSLLSSITTVDLTGQNFTRGIPSSWFKTDSWPELKNLFLTNNPLGGVLPESQPGAMPVLIQLDLSNCNLAGPLPKSWGRDETSMRQTQILYVELFISLHSFH